MYFRLKNIPEMIKQTEITLPPFQRGFHLITSIIENALQELPATGLLHLFVKHTSAGITLNENADPTVRRDFETLISRLIPDGDTLYIHSYEGPDDMPAHIKSSVIGQQITLPITNGHLNLGIWQGIYFCEFRNHGGRRKVILTLYY